MASCLSLELEYILAWERRRAQEEMKAAQTRARRNSRSSCDVRRSIDKHGVWTRITTPALEKMACIEKVKQEMAKVVDEDLPSSWSLLLALLTTLVITGNIIFFWEMYGKQALRIA